MLPSQGLYFPLVLNCLYVECSVLYGGSPKQAEPLSNKDIVERLREALLLSSADTHDNKKTRAVFDESRVSRALQGLTKAGLAERLHRGSYRITQKGKNLLESDMSLLGIAQICTDAMKSGASFPPRFTKKKIEELKALQDPEEYTETYNLANTLLEILCDRSPDGNWDFEKTACDVVSQMTGLKCEPTSHVADDGIDGLCYDENGDLAAIIQAKRFRGIKKVSYPPISRLVGDCLLSHVTKGYFVTTSTFSDAALKKIEPDTPIKIELIDGRKVHEVLTGSSRKRSSDGEKAPIEPVQVEKRGVSTKTSHRVRPKAKRKREAVRDYGCIEFAKILEKKGQDAYPVSSRYYKKQFEKSAPLSNTVNDQTVSWFWNNDSKGSGEFIRKKPNSSARTCYQRLGNPVLLIWIAEAVGIEGKLIQDAYRKALKAPSSASACATIRSLIPWDEIVEQIQQ